MPHENLTHIFLFINCRESCYFEHILKLWIFHLQTIYNLFQVCCMSPVGSKTQLILIYIVSEILRFRYHWCKHELLLTPCIIWATRKLGLVLPYYGGINYFSIYNLNIMGGNRGTMRLGTVSLWLYSNMQILKKLKIYESHILLYLEQTLELPGSFNVWINGRNYSKPTGWFLETDIFYAPITQYLKTG